MDLDSGAGAVLVGSAVLVLVGLLVYVIAGSRVAWLLGIQQDSVLLWSPRAGQIQGLVVAYLAFLVGVGALVLGLVDLVVPDSGPLPWSLGLLAAAWAAASTMGRVSKRVVTLWAGRVAFEDDVPQSALVPVDEAAGDVDLRAALDAVDAGEWQVAAALLGATADHDVRADRQWALAQHAALRSAWLEEWMRARPDDGLALGLRAHVEMVRAWEVRGAGYAETLTQRQIEQFTAGLAEAERLARRACELAPADPGPRALLVEMARGQEVDADEFTERWAALEAVEPFHVRGHQAALQTLCAKWMGSTDTMFAFARERAAEAPAGSAVQLLVLAAHVEHYLDLVNRSTSKAVRHMESAVTRAEMRAAVDRWLAGPPRPGHELAAHNLAAYAFWLAEDVEAARPHLTAMGEHLVTWPWEYTGEPSVVHGSVRRWAFGKDAFGGAAPAGPGEELLVP